MRLIPIEIGPALKWWEMNDDITKGDFAPRVKASNSQRSGAIPCFANSLDIICTWHVLQASIWLTEQRHSILLVHNFVVLLIISGFSLRKAAPPHSARSNLLA